MEFQLLPSGERAVIVEVDDLDAVLALADAVQRRVDEARAELARARAAAGRQRPESVLPPDPTDPDASERAPGDSVTVHVPPPPSQAANDDTSVWATVLDVIPAAQTVMLMVIDNEHLKPVRHLLSELAATLEVSSTAAHDQVVSVPVVYDGPDLQEVAELTGLSVDEVVAAHTGSQWRVAFAGFAPGFAYLVGGDPRLDVPRRSEPRTRVPVGAVGLAGHFSGIYPRSSPGGWQLIGHTDEVLWDEHRDPPALLRPGWGVRFEARSDGDSGGDDTAVEPDTSVAPTAAAQVGHDSSDSEDSADSGASGASEASEDTEAAEDTETTQEARA